MGLAIEHATLDPLPDTLEPFLNRIQEICSQFHIVSLNRQIEACKNLLHQDQLIDVAILGQFKAGKSSFLNSLIGKPILPVGVIPVTTTITRLQYGKKERAIIRHFDGQKADADLAEIAEFTSEAKNPANRKNVEMVDVDCATKLQRRWREALRSRPTGGGFKPPQAAVGKSHGSER